MSGLERLGKREPGKEPTDAEIEAKRRKIKETLRVVLGGVMAATGIFSAKPAEAQTPLTFEHLQLEVAKANTPEDFRRLYDEALKSSQNNVLTYSQMQEIWKSIRDLCVKYWVAEIEKAKIHTDQRSAFKIIYKGVMQAFHDGTLTPEQALDILKLIPQEFRPRL